VDLMMPFKQAQLVLKISIILHTALATEAHLAEQLTFT
jgi:hypothetical protein